MRVTTMRTRCLFFVALLAASCSSGSAAPTTVSPTLPPDFSVPLITFTTEPAAGASIDCVGLIGSFAGLATDPVAAREALSAGLDQVASVAEGALDGDIAALRAALATVTDQASAVAQLAEPETAAALQRVQAFVQAQCS
jgi:choline-glycine betaine transporter